MMSISKVPLNTENTWPVSIVRASCVPEQLRTFNMSKTLIVHGDSNATPPTHYVMPPMHRINHFGQRQSNNTHLATIGLQVVFFSHTKSTDRVRTGRVLLLPDVRTAKCTTYFPREPEHFGTVRGHGVCMTAAAPTTTSNFQVMFTCR
jgi:hypothetical protein